MPETQTCPCCGRTWEYTATKSYCPKCLVKIVTDAPVRRVNSAVAVPAAKEPVEIAREFSGLRDTLRRNNR